MKPKRTAAPQRILQADEWVSLDVEDLKLSFSIADSVLAEFVLSHDPSALREGYSDRALTSIQTKDKWRRLSQVRKCHI